MVAYTAVSDQSDPEGDYLCGSCMMRIGKGKTGGCSAVTGLISFTKGGCNVYKHGPAATEGNINPNRLSKDEAGYVEHGPFGCRRCVHYVKAERGCHRVMGLIMPKECCNVQQRQGSLHDALSTS